MKIVLAILLAIGVNAHCYDFLPVHDTPAPKGYQPFYISHYGRHGARADMGDKYYPYIIDSLTTLSQQQPLTARQDSLLALTQRVYGQYANMNRRLTPVGQYQHTQLAKRMANRYPTVFKGTPRVRAISSMVPRCIMSMNAFTNALTAAYPRIQYTFDCGERFQEYINCRGLLNLTYQTTPPVIDSLLQPFSFTPDKWTEAIYQTCIYAPCFGLSCNIYDFLTPEQVQYYDARNNYHFYINYCNTPYGKMRRPYAQLGLNDIIQKADSVIAHGGYAADLRFGHDDPLLTIVSAMELEGVGNELEYKDILTQWPGDVMVPMAANVQLIFYKNKKGDVLVKALYNEKECHIHGLKAVDTYYYRWADVRAKWLHTHRLATYNVRYVNKKNGDVGEKFWGNRRNYVIQNVLDNHLDIVGMQEVTGNNKDSLTGKSQLQDLKDGLPQYTCIAYEREDKKYSYNCIFYLTDKYDCLDHHAFWLSETPEVASKGWGSTFYRRCIVAHMQDKQTKQQFYFCCAHTDYDPLEVGEKQAQLIGETLAPLAANHTPIVLVGDLNHDRYDKPSIYHIYSQYFLDSSDSHFPTYQRWKTTSDSDFSGLEIDYLFYLNMTPYNRQVVTTDYGRSVAPSDHFPVYVDFQLGVDPTYDEIR